MMRNAFSLLMAVAICAGFVVVGCAPEADNPARDRKAEAKVKTRSFTGEVTDVDGVARTVTVKRAKNEEVFDASSIVGIDKIRPGKRVTVKYTEHDGRKIAKTVMPARRAKTGKKKAERRSERKDVGQDREKEKG